VPIGVGGLLNVLDRAVRAAPGAAYFWGVIAASVAVAVISRLNGLSRLTFVALVAAFVGMLTFYGFSQIQKATDAIVRLAGYAILMTATLAFVFVIVTSAWLGIFCTPRLFAYLYGVSEVCYGAARAEPIGQNSQKSAATYNVCEGEYVEPEKGNRCQPYEAYTYCGTLNSWATNACKQAGGSGEFGAQKLRDVLGNKCGYANWRITCK
jgi:hypothetical protein